jgi:hypothetical protein
MKQPGGITQMSRLRRSTERGQAAILLALAFVVLLGFAALAIDGGMVYADRRHAQSIADAASLAGGAVLGQHLEINEIFYTNWTCSGVVAEAMLEAKIAAINRASSNGELIDLNIADKHGVDAVCSLGPKKYIDIITWITRDTRTSFVHFVYQGPVRNTVEAVTRIYPRMPLGGGYAIVALNDGVCNGGSNGATFTGNGAVLVGSGGVFSNGCLTGEGNSLTVDAYSDISYAGSMDVSHPERFSPSPSQGSTVARSDFAVPPPVCGTTNYPAFESGGSQPLWHLPAGNYPSIKIKHPTTLEGGGLYCMTGNFIVEGSGTLSIDTSNGKTGVTIYLISGGFSTAGTNRVNLSAPPEEPDPSPALPGILIYLAEGNTSTAVLTGTSGSNYSGVVLAPSGRISALGTSEGIGFNTAFIGNNVDVRGTASVNIDYFANNVYSSPTSLELSK